MKDTELNAEKATDKVMIAVNKSFDQLHKMLDGKINDGSTDGVDRNIRTVFAKIRKIIGKLMLDI